MSISYQNKNMKNRKKYILKRKEVKNVIKRNRKQRNISADKLAAKAMFENSIASVTEYTGFVPRIPDSEEAANSYNDICTGAPVTALDGSEAYKKAR